MLRAVVDIFENDDEDIIEPWDVARRTGFDEATVQRAVNALYKHPYLDQDAGMKNANGDIVYIGEPTGEGLRAAGNWPSPENLADRIVAALERAAEDESRTSDERSRLKQVALGFTGAAYQVAIGALGGAGGNIIAG